MTKDEESLIIKKFREGKPVNEIMKELNLSRREVKDIIESYLNAKMISKDKRI